MNDNNKKLDIRTTKIMTTSIIGIVVNIFLFISKLLVGIISHSIVIISDSFNNLTDAFSSIISFITAYISQKPADKEHPFGHGRAEHAGAIVISIVIAYVGISLLIESIKKIFNPELPSFYSFSLALIVLSFFVKIIISYYFIKVGNDISSKNLVISGQDARFDAIISLTTLISALIFIKYGVYLEAYLSIIISLIILKSGISLLQDTFSIIEGERIDSGLSKAIKESINQFNDVKGVFDLTLNNYGNDKLIGSVHIEVLKDTTADRIDDLSREIQIKIYKEFSVILTAVGIYSIDLDDKEINDMHQKVLEMISRYDEILQIHGFSVNKIEKHIHFDIVLKFGSDYDFIKNEITSKMKHLYKEYDINIVIDNDVSD